MEGQSQGKTGYVVGMSHGYIQVRLDDDPTKMVNAFRKKLALIAKAGLGGTAPSALSTLDVSSVLAAQSSAQSSLAFGTAVRVIQGRFASKSGIIIGANHGYYQVRVDESGEVANAYRKNLEIDSADASVSCSLVEMEARARALKAGALIDSIPEEPEGERDDDDMTTRAQRCLSPPQLPPTAAAAGAVASLALAALSLPPSRLAACEPPAAASFSGAPPPVTAGFVSPTNADTADSAHHFANVHAQPRR
jgi:hypothetical protein